MGPLLAKFNPRKYLFPSGSFQIKYVVQILEAIIYSWIFRNRYHLGTNIVESIKNTYMLQCIHAPRNDLHNTFCLLDTPHHLDIHFLNRMNGCYQLSGTRLRRNLVGYLSQLDCWVGVDIVLSLRANLWKKLSYFGVASSTRN